jgi:hypothetical protein
MLRFSYYRSDGGELWKLSGCLSGPQADELCSVWRRIRGHMPHVRPVVDLKDVTFIDESGEELLLEMQSAGAKFIAAGVEHKHLLANLNGGRTRTMEHLGGGRR